MCSGRNRREPALSAKFRLKEYLQSGWKAVDVRKYAEGTQEATDPALKAAEIVGKAVATIVESSVETRMQSASPKKTAMTFLCGSRLV